MNVAVPNQKQIDLGWSKVKLTGDPKDEYFKNIDNYLNGSPELWHFVGAHLPPDAVVFDCGANIGATVLMMATRCPQGHVYAFEASPKNIAILRKNIEINGITNVTVIEGALAEKEKDVAFVETHSGAGNHVITPGGVKHAEANLKLRTHTLDGFLKSGFNHSRLDFIKMDIEGYEPPALLGARNVLSTFKPRILLEVNSFTLLFAHRFDPIDFVDYLWDQFDVHSVGHGGKLEKLTDKAGFLYKNMVLHQCVSDVLLVPHSDVSVDALSTIVLLGDAKHEVQKLREKVANLKRDSLFSFKKIFRT